MSKDIKTTAQIIIESYLSEKKTAKRKHTATISYTPAKGKMVTKTFTVDASNPKEAELHFSRHVQMHNGIKTKMHRIRHHKPIK